MSDAAALTMRSLAAMPLPPLDGAGDKEARGRVLAVAGSEAVPGAAILTGLAALRAGAGKLQLAVPGALALGLGLKVPEARVIAIADPPPGRELLEAAAKPGAVILGPGWIDESWSRAVGAALLDAGDEESAFVIDAAALILAEQMPSRVSALGGRAVLTPHAGEAAKVLGWDRAEIEADPLAAARVLAERCGAVVALKGATTWIVGPDGRAWRHDGGSIGLATSGSGDVLAGMIGGFLARGASPGEAAAWGVTLHGAAGARLGAAIGEVGYLARELLAVIPHLLAEPGAASGRHVL